LNVLPLKKYDFMNIGSKKRMDHEIVEEEAVDGQLHSKKTIEREVRPRDVRPQAFDVLLGRGKSNVNHPGNKQYKGKKSTNPSLCIAFIPCSYCNVDVPLCAPLDCINSYTKRYLDSPMFIKKSFTMEILHIIQQTGRFLVKKGKVWSVVPDGVARQKIAHSIQYRQRLSSRNDHGTNIISEDNVHGTYCNLYGKRMEPMANRIQSRPPAVNLKTKFCLPPKRRDAKSLAFEEFCVQTDIWSHEITNSKNPYDISDDPKAPRICIGAFSPFDPNNSIHHSNTEDVVDDRKMPPMESSTCPEGLTLTHTTFSTQVHANALGLMLDAKDSHSHQPPSLRFLEVDSTGNAQKSHVTMNPDNKINYDEDLPLSSLYRTSSEFSQDSCHFGWTGPYDHFDANDDIFSL
jgi:hypothetical protein